MRPGHRPLYPSYRPRPRAHLICAWRDDGAVATEDGEVVGPFPDRLALSAWLLAHRADLLVRSLMGWLHFPALVRDPRFRAMAAGRARTLRASCAIGRRGRDWCGVYATDDVDPERAMAARLAVRSLHPDLGTRPTPSAFGAALMRALVEGRHTTPSRACLRDLRAGLHGGRQICFEEAGTSFEEVWETDRYMAYVSEAMKGVPIGTAVGLGGPWQNAVERRIEADRCATWYGKVVVYIDKPLRYGVFPIRKGEKMIYPTLKGRYETWLWREEVEYAENQGLECWIIRGWGWEKIAPVLAAWALEIARLRENSPDDLSRQFVKRAGQAAIGLHAMAPGRRLIVPLDGEGRCPMDGGMPMEYQAVPDPDADPDPPLMLHWASYIYAQARLSLYATVQSEWEVGNGVLLANTDAVYTRRRPDADPRPGLGGARLVALHRFTLLAGNAYTCDERTIRPGVSRDNELRAYLLDKELDRLIRRPGRRASERREEIRAQLAEWEEG